MSWLSVIPTYTKLYQWVIIELDARQPYLSSGVDSKQFLERRPSLAIQQSKAGSSRFTVIIIN